MKTKVEHLREHLFATIEDLRDAEKPMDIDRAKTIAKVGQVIVESAKAETNHIRTINGLQGSDFFPDGPRPQLPAYNGNGSLTHEGKGQ